MTHGEELGSDVHQDSIVLTYLEGLLMHQAAEGSGTAVDKASAGRNEDDQNFNISGSAFPTCQRNGPVLSTTGGVRSARGYLESPKPPAPAGRRLTGLVLI